MPADSGFFRVGSVSMARGGLLPALRHNKRDLPERGHIDPTRTHLNYALAPTDTGANSAQAIDKYARKRLIDLDITPRKNAVLAIEAIFSLPASWHSRNNQAFFVACFEWIAGAIQGELLSFDVHLDESAPHAHALILPLIDGKLKGSEILGGKGNIYRLQRAFANTVGVAHGLPMNKRLPHSERTELARAVLAHLNAQHDPAMQSQTWAIIQDTIKRNPQPFADLLGVVLHQPKPKRRQKSFVKIMTSKGKGQAKREIPYIGN